MLEHGPRTALPQPHYQSEHPAFPGHHEALEDSWFDHVRIRIIDSLFFEYRLNGTVRWSEESAPDGDRFVLCISCGLSQASTMASQPDHPYAFAFSPNSDKDWTDIEHTSEDGRTNTSNIKTEPLEDSPSVSVEDWMDTDVHFRAFTLLQTPVPDETFPTDAIHPQTEMEETSLWPGYPGPDQQTQATQPVDHDPGFQMNWPSERPANSSSTYEEQDHSDQLQQNRHNVNDSVWQVEYGGLGQVSIDNLQNLAILLMFAISKDLPSANTTQHQPQFSSPERCQRHLMRPIIGSRSTIQSSMTSPIAEQPTS